MWFKFTVSEPKYGLVTILIQNLFRIANNKKNLTFIVILILR
jgi:hypothetical protein